MSILLNASPLANSILDFIKGKDILDKRDFTAEAEAIKPLLTNSGDSDIDVLSELQDISFYECDFEGMLPQGADPSDYSIALSRFKDAINVSYYAC